MLSLFTSLHPLFSKYCLIAVPVHAVTMSLIVTFNCFEAFFTPANFISDDVADNFFPLKFLTPSFNGLRSCFTFRSFHATLGKKKGTLSFISNLSKKLNFLGNGISRLISKLSPYPIWKFMQDIPSHKEWCCLYINRHLSLSYISYTQMIHCG